MYLSFYGFKKEPFQITPDPEFLFLSPSHKEAMGSIIYGVEQRKGFVSIIGEVGTGKTTIIRSYLERADRGRVKPIYVFHAHTTFKELLTTIFREMGRTPKSEDVYEMVRGLQEVLIEEYRKDHNIVLIIDEAQNMPVETLEQLRMLSNLETTKQKLIQIILAGQPELEDKLNLVQLRQLKQRLAIRAVIKPLTFQESVDYIHHRLSRVSSSHEAVFTNRALARIIKHAGGAPRILNILCDNALIAGYGFQKKPVSAGIVKAVIRDYEGSAKVTKTPMWKYATAATAAILAGVGVYAALSMNGVAMHLDPRNAPFFLNSSRETSAVPHPAPIAPAASARIESQEVQAAPSGLGGTAEPVAPAKPAPRQADERPTRPPKAPEARPAEAPSQKQEVMARATEPEQAPRQAETPRKTEPLAASQASEPVQAQSALPASQASQAPQTHGNEPVRHEPRVQLLSTQPQLQATRSDMAPPGPDIRPVMRIEVPRPLPESKSFPVVRVVQRGDWLIKLCTETYGFSSDRIVQWIKDNNPQIVDVNNIVAGDRILFPELTANLKNKDFADRPKP